MQFRQIQELKREIQNEIKGNHQNQELYPPGVAIWPHPGHGNTAFSRLCQSSWGSVCSPIFVRSSPLGFAYKDWVWPRFCGFVEEVEGAFAPLSSYTPPRWILPINTGFFRDHRERPCRDRFQVSFLFFLEQVFIFILCNFYFFVSIGQTEIHISKRE